MKKILGIELGSTRIKAVLTDENAKVIAKGIYDWENKLVGGLWSYTLEQALEGVAESYARLAADYRDNTGEFLEFIDAIGVSGMMHGYLALDAEDNQTGIFQTWRNTHTGAAAEELSETFRFNVPQRWSVAQYYQAVLNGEEHVKRAAKLFTLASFVHYKLTGRFVIGIGDASGMFPVTESDYDAGMIGSFDRLLSGHGMNVSFRSLLPDVLRAGENAGYLNEEGAKLLDHTGRLRPGTPLCPPEGDMQTNMVCADTIRPGVANISAGTSSNVSVVLEKPLRNYRPEIDVLSTPDGRHAALIHSNNCTSEINEWVSLFSEVASLCGADISRPELFKKLFTKSLESDGTAGSIVSYNFLAGEAIAGCETGALTLSRSPSGRLTLANFMQAQIFSAIGALSLGVGLLAEEGVVIRSATAAGGFYKTDFVGQNATSAVFGVPVTIMQNAGEGGAWGMAILALYMLRAGNTGTDAGDRRGTGLASFLDGIFAGTERTTVEATEAECEKYRNYFNNYRKLLAGERKMAELFRD